MATLIRLASCPIGQSSTQSLVDGTVVYLLSGMDPNDEDMVTHASQASVESESMLLMSVGVGWSHWLIVPGSILLKPWIISCFLKRQCALLPSLSALGHSSPRGRNLDQLVGLASLPNTVILRHKAQLRGKGAVTHPDRTVHLRKTHSG